jgi:hypothetical protein
VHWECGVRCFLEALEVVQDMFVKHCYESLVFLLYIFQREGGYTYLRHSFQVDNVGLREGGALRTCTYIKHNA